MLHEVLHGQGFQHTANSVDCGPGAPGDGLWPMNELSDKCMEEVIDDSAWACNIVNSSCGNGGKLVVTHRGATQPSDCTCVEPSCFDFLDMDNDGLGDRCDSCPGDPVPDPDSDGLCSTDLCPNRRDTKNGDSDLDGIGDVCDPCPLDSVQDVDHDGFCSSDNCPTVLNNLQLDQDSDGLGNNCDPDLDGDGDPDKPPADNCPYDYNPNQSDSDQDGRGDVCDCDEFVLAGPNTGCTGKQIRWAATLLMDERMQALAYAMTPQGVRGPFGPWSQFATCKWGCPGHNPYTDQTYTHTLNYLNEFGRPQMASREDIYRIFMMDPAVQPQHFSNYFAARIGEGW